MLNYIYLINSTGVVVVAFLVCFCVVGMLIAHGSSGFWILLFMFLKYVFFVFILDAIFYGTSFFLFQDSVWQVKKS